MRRSEEIMAPGAKRALAFAAALAAAQLACSSSPSTVLVRPVALAVAGSGVLYVADAAENVIWVVAPGGSVTALAGTPGQTGSLDGTGPTAEFNAPSGVALDATGNLFVTDYGNHTIRKVSPQGLVSTFAGIAGQPGFADGTGSAALFNRPWGIAVAPAGSPAEGTLFVADAGNSTIRAISPAGVVTTFAGTAGQPGSADGTGGAASFDWPAGVAFDGSGNLYVADYVNDTVRVISPAAVVSTLAGTAGQAGSVDGTGAEVVFHNPAGVGVDGSGNVFVADSVNDTIRKVTPAPAVSTLAGAPGQVGSSDGMGSAALFNHPYGLAMDSSGNVYVADSLNGLVRLVTPAGLVTTINTSGR